MKLTYRTARRSTTLRIRKPAGTKVLAGGSKGIRVRALATSRLRASASVRVRPNPWRSDAGGNGTLDYLYDADRDGYPELQCLDRVGNDAVADPWVDARLVREPPPGPGGTPPDAPRTGAEPVRTADRARAARLSRPDQGSGG